MTWELLTSTSSPAVLLPFPPVPVSGNTYSSSSPGSPFPLELCTCFPKFPLLSHEYFGCLLSSNNSACYMCYILCFIPRKAVLKELSLLTTLPEAVRPKGFCKLCSPSSCAKHDYISYLKFSCLPRKFLKYNLI